ncbi:CHC2 zinc finger domain-containing protein [Coprococcus sp. AF102-57]|uniref:CHC2 zinc finger domain-containing protein n=1 Tax=Coprococcus sp. AF102-57 TaxID=2997946 RepID=UPI0022E93FA7|nr:CHC2 zinc finger domain-containing protein [Coprococcus sp. AF102-57]
MNVFEAVKQSVTTRQAAEHYGIHVGRNGMACCPFHHDKTPSMKLDRRYHCFGCGADGDVIDFAAALYGLGKKEAAVQLAQDFGLSYEDWNSPEEQFQEAKNRCFRILADYLHLLRVWRKEYAPHSPEEVFHPRFVEALQKQDHVEYLLDVLLFGETEEKAALITEYGKDVIQLEQRMAELAAADAARTKKHHERHAAYRERRCPSEHTELPDRIPA